MDRRYRPRPFAMNALAAKFLISAPNIDSCPALQVPEFAFIGRSNVGKSSLLNMLAGVKALAKVSATPGHTQLINFFAVGTTWTLVDLPGYGYAQRARTERDRFQQMIAGYLCGRANLNCVFVLIDSRHEPQTIDLEFVGWLLGERVPFALVFSKADKVKPGRLAANVEHFQAKIAAWCEELPRVFITSAETRAGRPELLAFIRERVASAAAGHEA
jgi:GTP-binding protein